jgi:hypothetical protein
MNMDPMQLEAFLDARCGHATEQANRHLSEKARHDEEAQRSKQIASFCGRAAVRVRGLREYLLDAPSGLTIGITATVEAEPAPAPSTVDEPAAVAVAGDEPAVAGNAPVSQADAATECVDRVDDIGVVDGPLDAFLPFIPAATEVALAMGEARSPADPDSDEADAPTPLTAGAMEERLVPRFAVTPESDGLTDYDQRFLDVMRLNLDRHGICSLKPADIAEIAGLARNVAGVCIAHLMRHRRIVRVSRGFRVSQQGASFPPVGEREPVAASIPAPKPKISPSAPVPSLQPVAVECLAEKLMELFVKAATNAGDGMAMFGREGLEKRFDVSAHRIEEAVYLLESRGDIEWIQGLKGHITVKVLKQAEAAA